MSEIVVGQVCDLPSFNGKAQICPAERVGFQVADGHFVRRANSRGRPNQPVRMDRRPVCWFWFYSGRFRAGI